MTKTTSTAKASFLKAAIIPVLSALTMLLCTKTIAQEKSKTASAYPDRIDVTTVTKNELDSLQKTDPVKYKGKESDFMKTKMSYADKKGTQSFNKKQQEYTLNLGGAIKSDPAKIKAIEINQLTQTEMDALKKHDSVMYNDVTLKDYSAIRITQVNDEGRLETLTTYEKKPKNN
ncbi:hypothetical protein D3C87_330810 [compost metagenome]